MQLLFLCNFIALCVRFFAVVSYFSHSYCSLHIFYFCFIPLIFLLLFCVQYTNRILKAFFILSISYSVFSNSFSFQLYIATYISIGNPVHLLFFFLSSPPFLCVCWFRAFAIVAAVVWVSFDAAICACHIWSRDRFMFTFGYFATCKWWFGGHTNSVCMSSWNPTRSLIQMKLIFHLQFVWSHIRKQKKEVAKRDESF